MAANSIDATFIEHFTKEAHLVYQGASILKGTAMTKHGIIGNKVHFPVLGHMRMRPRLHRTPLPPVNAEWTRPEAEMSDWILAELTDVFEDIKSNVDDRRYLAKAMMKAVGRQEDQFYLKALMDAAARSGSNVENEEVGSSANTAFDPTKSTSLDNTKPSYLLGACKEKLLDNEVGENIQLTALLPARWYNAFAADPVIANQFYGKTDVQRSGMMPPSHKIRLIFMGDRRRTATDVSNIGAGWSSQGGVGYVWAEDSLGLGYGMDPRLKIEWLPDYQCHLVCVGLSASAVAVDETGIVRITNGPTG